MADGQYMGGVKELDISYPTEVLGTLGFYICVIGLASYTIKERLYLSNAVLALGIGVAVGPVGLNWISVDKWTSGDERLKDQIVYEITRIVVGIQVLFTGIDLPKRYLRHEWRSLAVLLLPVMTVAWFVSSLIVWGFVPGITFLEALVIGACVTPTDPVLAASVVKGRFAEKYVATNVRDLIAAESGANDGLGFPFIYLALYLIVRHETAHDLGWAIKTWVVQEILYDILMSCVIGGVIGYIGMKTLRYADTHGHIDHESFLAYGIVCFFGLAFFVLGVVGVVGSDDILACFVAGNSLSWDDFVRLKMEEDHFQNVIDNLIDSAVFIFIGTIIPWGAYVGGNDLAVWRVFVIAILILLFRRLPCVLVVYRLIPSIETIKEALFLGWFGPIGVGAVYYVQVALRELPEDRSRTIAVIAPVVYFVVVGSVIVHGVTIPTIRLRENILTRTKSVQSGSRTNTMELPTTNTKNNKSSQAPQQSVAGQNITFVGAKAINEPQSIIQSPRSSVPATPAAQTPSSQTPVGSRPATPSSSDATAAEDMRAATLKKQSITFG